MAQASVKYQCKHMNQTAWSAGNTVVNLSDVSRSAVKAFLLSRNPNWSDVRIIEIIKK
ncbi:MAG: hypothetical protein IKA22_04635 [Lentisphaeria bacterium]|nr:hypothetical protein [Lentisphaeria bacterium]